MIIYFARSIRGRHKTDDQLINAAIVDAIHQAGMVPAFETHQIAHPVDWTWDKFVYFRDVAWLDRSSALIAEVTNPSLGVGFEIAYAAHVRRIPVLCVAEKDTTVSAMIAGGFDVFYYRDRSDLAADVRDFLSSLQVEHE